MLSQLFNKKGDGPTSVYLDYKGSTKELHKVCSNIELAEFKVLNACKCFRITTDAPDKLIKWAKENDVISSTTPFKAICFGVFWKKYNPDGCVRVLKWKNRKITEIWFLTEEQRRQAINDGIKVKDNTIAVQIFGKPKKAANH